MKKILLLVIALALSLSLVACKKDDNKPANNKGDNDKQGEESDISKKGDAGDSEDPEWWGLFVGEDGYALKIIEYDKEGFSVEIIKLKDDSVVLDGNFDIDSDNNHKADSLYGKLNITLSEDFNEVDFLAGGTEWDYLSGVYTIVDKNDRYGLTGRGDYIEEDNSKTKKEGNGDSVDSKGSDPGDTDAPNWWGEYLGDEFSIGISNFNGTSFKFSIYLLRNGKVVKEGVAALYPDEPLMAEYGQMSFSLYEDFSGVDLFAPESSEWSHMRGRYLRID